VGERLGGDRLNLCASLVVRNELSRYLAPCIEHLLAFCDTVVVLDDASDDGTGEWLRARERSDERLSVEYQFASSFYKHEGRTRQLLLEVTLEQKPTHVLNLDADELVSDGAALRACIGREPDVPIWSLVIEEVWNGGDTLQIREDSGWRSHPLPVLWRVDAKVRYAIMQRRLACRRVPTQVLRSSSRAVPSGESLLHLGWSNPKTRAERHSRYVTHDGGRFHASAHLDSILWPDEKIELRERAWPDQLLQYREAILERTAQTL
jgi:hypothetical protein